MPTKAARRLTAANIEVLSQVANYNGQIVALKTRAGYVPTSPSGSAPDIPTTQIDNPKNWAGYGTTVGTLRDVARRTGLPVAPKAKVLEGGLVVGILVESGQFVQLSVPAEDTVNDGLTPVSTGDPVAADQATFAETGEDTERTDMTRRIALEGQYFAAFRNTLRYVLSRAEHVAVRKRVEALVASHAPYLERLRDIDALLREVGQPYVRFAEFGEVGTAAATKVAMCASLSDCSSSANCISAGGTCVLVAPLRHLITGGPNEHAYYGRVADELVRYPRARRYILDRGEYLQIGALNYDLAPDEIVVLGGVLFGQYFNGLVALPPNPYTTAPTYEDVVTAQSADAAVEVVDLRGAAQVSGCVGAKRPLGSTEKWWHLLPSDTYIVPYTPAALCGFELVAAIASDMTGELISQSMLRDELARGYEDLLKAQNLGGLVRTLRAQKKNDIAARYLAGVVSMPDLVMTEDYYLTNLDLRILARRLSLPLVIISGKNVVDNKKPALATPSVAAAGAMYIVKQHGVASNSPQKYSLLYHEDRMAFPVEVLSDAARRTIAGGAGYPLLLPPPPGAKRLVVVDRLPSPT